MAFASEFHMPGAYRFADGQTPTGQPLSHTMVRPPMSPSASSSVYNLAKSTGSLYSDMSMATPITPGANSTKRKRTRARESTPMTDWMNMDGAGDARDDGDKIRYTLAGQIETPGTAPLSAGGILDESMYSDVNYRRELGPKRGRDEMESPASNTAQTGGWSTLALHTIGGVVGKVWEFCTTGAFRGFHAGGGKGYEMGGIAGQETQEGEKSGTTWPNEQSLPTPFTDNGIPSSGPNLPGNFPKSDYTYFPDYNEMSSAENTPRPAAKRRQVSHSKETKDDLIRNWVIVDERESPAATSTQQVQKPAPTTTTATSFTRPTSRASARPSLRSAPRYSTPTTASSRRINVPVSRLSNTPQAISNNKRTPLRPSTSHREPSFVPRSPAASTASFRAASPALASPSRIPLPTNPSGIGLNPFARPSTANQSQSRLPSRPSSRASLSHCASPLPTQPPRGHRRNHSNASAGSVSSPIARRKTLGESVQVNSPRLTAEAKQLATKKMLADREADVKMEVFNMRLMDMIRQGKEALGTTVEVEMDCGGLMETPGWVDDE